MHLTAKEVIHLRQWVNTCYENKRKHQITDRKYTQKMTPKGIIMMGKAGEVIAARHYNTTIDWEIYIGPDQGHDIQIHGETTEIKTSTHKQLIINDPKHCNYGLWKPHTKQCLLVWCNQTPTQLENIGTNTQFQILGATTRQHFFANAQPANYGHGPRLTLKQHQLTHI
jgi:hypothetical protein